MIVSTGYEPREAFVPFHMRRERWACLVCHRRAGKTVACVADLVDAALRCEKPNPRYAYLAPYYTQAKDVAWTYLKQMVAHIPGVGINEGELRVDLPNDARVRLYGADNYDRMRGIYLDGVVLDEYADMDPRAWPEVIRPALSDRRGWATFIGTPKGRNDFYDLHQMARSRDDWFDFVLTADTSGLVDEAELEDARQSMTEEQFAQEYLCSFDAAIKGAYFGREIAQAERDGRVGDFPHMPDRLVHTAWDIGVGDPTAIWCFQMDGPNLRIIDHYENVGFTVEHYVEWLEARPYTYGTDWIPHDGRQREWTGGGPDHIAKGRIETMLRLGRKPRLVTNHRVDDGINAARLTLARCWFHHETCQFGLKALSQYRADFDEKTKAFRNTPKHDWTSHTADAFRYLASGWREMKAPTPEETADPHGIESATWNELMEQHAMASAHARRI